MVLFALTRVKAFDDRCRVDEIPSAQDAHEVRIELGDLYSGRSMHLVRNEQQPCPGKSNNRSKKECQTIQGRGRSVGDAARAPFGKD